MGAACLCCKPPTQLDECGLASYEGMLPKLREGDLVLFRTNTIKCAAQRAFCGAEFDHVGILVHDWHCGEDDTMPCCRPHVKELRARLHARTPTDAHFMPWHTLESTGSGVDVFPFNRHRIKSFDGVVAIRRLRVPASCDRRKLCSKLVDFMNRVKGLPYPSNISTILRAADVLGPSDQDSDLKSFFCSELVAAAYQHIDMLQAGRFANMYLPGDFSTTGCVERRAIFNRGFTLGGEVVLNPFMDKEELSQHEGLGSVDYWGNHQILETATQLDFYRSHPVHGLGSTIQTVQIQHEPTPADSVPSSPLMHTPPSSPPPPSPPSSPPSTAIARDVLRHLPRLAVVLESPHSLRAAIDEQKDSLHKSRPFCNSSPQLCRSISLVQRLRVAEDQQPRTIRHLQPLSTEPLADNQQHDNGSGVRPAVHKSGASCSDKPLDLSELDGEIQPKGFEFGKRSVRGVDGVDHVRSVVDIRGVVEAV